MGTKTDAVIDGPFLKSAHAIHISICAVKKSVKYIRNEIQAKKQIDSEWKGVWFFFWNAQMMDTIFY